MKKMYVKIILSAFIIFIVFSIIFCAGSDFAFYLDFGILWAALASIMTVLIICLKSGLFKKENSFVNKSPCSAETYDAPKMEFVTEDYDVREVNFSIDGPVMFFNVF